MFGLSSITNRLTKAVRDIGSGFRSNPIAGAALGLPFLFSDKGFPSLGSSLFGNTTGGGIGDLLKLFGSGLLAFKGFEQFGQDKEMAMKMYDDMMDRLKATDRKYGSEFGGSPFKEEQFANLIADIKTGETFDKFQGGSPVRTIVGPEGKAIVAPPNPNPILKLLEDNVAKPADPIPFTNKDTITSAKGGIASLMAGGPPEQDMGQFGSPFMGSAENNPFNPMNRVSGMIAETPLRQVMPPTMNMGGQATGVPGLTPDMSGPEMMDTIEDNPGITSFFPRRLGMIDGPGGPKDDKIPAMLSDGEFVFTAKAVENAGGPRAMYNMMNKLDPESSKGRGII